MPIHPSKKRNGTAVNIDKPHTPTPLASWDEPTEMATVVPGGAMPRQVNGVACDNAWLPALERADWEAQTESMVFEEPPFEETGKAPAAGAVVVEPDGRLWLVSPTNGFGGSTTTFPKGKAKGMSLKATALKEVCEEAGLEVELFQHLVDVTKTTSRTRYYLARRTGGNPANMCWETQAVHLVPLEKASEMLDQKVDHKVVDALCEKWGEWVWWFSYPELHTPAWASAALGAAPARRQHWAHLPLPVRRARIPLDIRLDRAEADALKLGFIPQDMDEKWFAYFESDTLYEHRSWTGFCITEVHFVPDGEGLRATYADVNREPLQYGNTDDAEDAILICERIRQLASERLRERDSNNAGELTDTPVEE